jgi:DNA gyrase/topoisomerase IV subunit A
MNQIMDSDDLSCEVLDALENINDSLENKILNYASIIKTIEAKSQSISNAIDDMIKRADSLNKSAECLRDMVKTEMTKCEKNKVENDYHEVKLKLNNPKVDYLDMDLIPSEFMRKKIKSIEEPNAILILKALKDNVYVPGVRMVRESRLEIR